MCVRPQTCTNRPRDGLTPPGCHCRWPEPIESRDACMLLFMVIDRLRLNHVRSGLSGHQVPLQRESGQVLWWHAPIASFVTACRATGCVYETDACMKPSLHMHAGKYNQSIQAALKIWRLMCVHKHSVSCPVSRACMCQTCLCILCGRQLAHVWEQ